MRGREFKRKKVQYIDGWMDGLKEGGEQKSWDQPLPGNRRLESRCWKIHLYNLVGKKKEKKRGKNGGQEMRSEKIK